MRSRLDHPLGLALVAAASATLAGCTCGAEEPPDQPRVAAAPKLECNLTPDQDPRVVLREGAMRGREVFAMQRPVALLCDGPCAEQGDAATRCSGVLVTEDLFLTTRTCLGDPAADGEALDALARRKTVRFEVDDGAPSAQGADPADPAAADDGPEPIAVEVAALVEARLDDDVDYALLRLERPAGRRWGVAPLAREALEAKDLYVAHHPGGGAKRVARGTWVRGAGGAIEYAAASDDGSRGAPVFGGRDLRVFGMLRTPARCDEGVAAVVTPIDALLEASPTLAGLVTIRHTGNRTTLGTLEVYCGDRSCRRGPAFCKQPRGKREPCCDRDADGKPDDPPTCWEANQLGCAVECPAGTEVTWACSTGATGNRFVERVAVAGGALLDEDCGLGCDGRVTRPSGYDIECAFSEYD